MKLYTDQGWLAAAQIRAAAPTFTWICGGRGTGKTYGFLKSFRIDDPAPFILLRRTQAQIDMLSLQRFSPFRAIDADCGTITAVKKQGKFVTAFYDGIKDGDDIKPTGLPIGYAMALSTVHNIRGFSADVDAIIFDEFIPEAHERPITDEWESFLNCYETLDRNKQIMGKPATKVFALSNANRLANPYFIGMKMVRQFDTMVLKGQTVYEDRDKELMLINLVRSPISEAKAATALYKLSAGSGFAGMALANQFSGESRSRTGSWPLRELQPIVAIGELCLYRHKSNRELYGSTHISGAPEIFGTTDGDIARFRARYGWTWEIYMDDRIVWQDYLPEILYRKFIGETY